MTAWYNYIIIATFEGLKQPLLVVAKHQFSVLKIVLYCFKQFQVVQIVITSGQQPACHPMIISLINKIGDQFNNSFFFYMNYVASPWPTIVEK